MCVCVCVCVCICILHGAEVNLHDNELQYIRKMLVRASGSN